MTYKVAIVDAASDFEVHNAVNSAIDLVGGFSPKEKSKVVIKPNLCSGRKPPGSGATTRVTVVDALISYVNEQNSSCEILVVEGDSDRSADEAFRRLGYRELGKKYDNVHLVNLSKDKTVKIVLDKSKKLTAIEVPESLLFADYFVSVANLKRQVNERMTGVWKNQWGCLPHKAIRMRLHPFLSEALFDVNSVFWPDLCIIDGVVGLEGAGPIEGTPKQVGKILCSKDPLAIDVVAAKIIGEAPKSIPHLNYALKQLHRRPNDITIIGDRIESMNFKFITKRQYLLYRSSLRLRKAAEYLENAGYASSILAYALRAVGFSELTEGKMFSWKRMFQIGKDLLFKVEAAERAFG